MVLVDDRVPCDANGKPAFARNADERVYWVMILEKAYAKFAGSYSQMAGGTVTQGLEDITGGIGYKYNLLKEPHANWIPKRDGRGGEMPDMLWQARAETVPRPPEAKLRSLRALAGDHGEDEDGARDRLQRLGQGGRLAADDHRQGANPPLGTLTRPQRRLPHESAPQGIVVNRAYALVTGGEFEDNKLMRLRIPLDENGECREWTGRWSDKSSAWTGRLKQARSPGGSPRRVMRLISGASARRCSRTRTRTMARSGSSTRTSART